MTDLTHLYLDYQPRLLNFVSRFTCDEQESLDIVQDSFIKLMSCYQGKDEESVKKLAELNDTVIKLKGDFWLRGT